MIRKVKIPFKTYIGIPCGYFFRRILQFYVELYLYRGDIVNKDTNINIIQNEGNKKVCFVITPIGDDNSSIRRHIDGVINAAIRPALDEKYDVRVAHEFTSPGSINKQVIIEIYNADLVIANLTELNPNVMYELAIRHAFKKPVIMIMETGGNKLPFDVVNERTIFYKNDFQGVIDLKNSLKKTECGITEAKNISNPIYDALENYADEKKIIKEIENNDKENANVLRIILSKINDLENSIYNSNSEMATTRTQTIRRFHLNLEYLVELNEVEKLKIKDSIEYQIEDYMNCTSDFETRVIKSCSIDKIIVEIKHISTTNKRLVSMIARELFNATENIDKRVKILIMSKEIKEL